MWRRESMIFLNGLKCLVTSFYRKRKLKGKCLSVILQVYVWQIYTVRLRDRRLYDGPFWFSVWGGGVGTGFLIWAGNFFQPLGGPDYLFIIHTVQEIFVGKYLFLSFFSRLCYLLMLKCLTQLNVRNLLPIHFVGTVFSDTEMKQGSCLF